ncbi:MAG: PD-(D/E)XK nuclease family protein [Myxococcales bacterium]|nr:PD-(D/E)XK nuclease family protein [Myxococcales bacterium]
MASQQLTFADIRPRGPQLLVLPDAARVEEWLLGATRAQPFVAGKPACSLAELERELVREARRAGKCPAAATPQAFMLALREAAREHSHGRFFRIREQPGYARALGDLLATLTQGMLDPADLARLDVPERVATLGRTLVAARALLDKAGVVEAHRAVRIAIDRLEQGLALPPSLARAAEIEFDGILDWTPLRLRLATALASRMRVRIRLPWSADRPELIESLEPALRALERLGAGPAPELELFDPASGPLAPFLRRLFAAEGPPQDGPLALISCASPAAQAREVARRCASLLATGSPPDSIAVAARTLSGGVVEEIAAAFDRLGIPWRERRGRPALPAPPVRLALSLYQLIDEDFPREPLIDLLSSRLLWTREDGEHLPPQALARCLREAHARDEASEGGIAVLLSALAARRARNGHGSADVEETQVRVSRTISALRTLPQRATLREHGAALLELLAQWGLHRRLRAPEPIDAGPVLERAVAAALGRDQAALRCLDDACAGLARGAAQIGLAEKRFDRAAFAQVLAEALTDASLPPGGARGGAVQLVELRELPARTFDHLLMIGLVDGELPARPPIDPLLSDEERRAVNRAAQRTVFRDPATSSEPLLFQLALASARKSAALLWPRADASGRETVRSPFADEAARALGRSAEGVAIESIPRAEECAGPSDLLARAALDAFAEPAFRVSPPADPTQARALVAAVARSSIGPRLRRISRAAVAERERVRAFVGEIRPGRFSGQLSGAALEIAAAQFRFGPEAPASARQLEEHGTCGFRTLGHRLLRVERDEEDDAELGARQRGSLLHRCLERFFREAPLPLRGIPKEIELLREVAEREMADFAEEIHVGHRGLWELKRAALVDELIALIESEKEAQPIELERRFGFDEPDSWPALRIDDVHVRGAIDRIDRTAEGALVVLDYKSGHPERRKSGKLNVAEAVVARVARMRAGFFEVRPLNCDYCELKPACRLVALPTDPDENGGEVPVA